MNAFTLHYNNECILLCVICYVSREKTSLGCIPQVRPSAPSPFCPCQPPPHLGCRIVHRGQSRRRRERHGSELVAIISPLSTSSPLLGSPLLVVVLLAPPPPSSSSWRAILLVINLVVLVVPHWTMYPVVVGANMIILCRQRQGNAVHVGHVREGRRPRRRAGGGDRRRRWRRPPRPRGRPDPPPPSRGRRRRRSSDRCVPPPPRRRLPGNIVVVVASDRGLRHSRVVSRAGSRGSRRHPVEWTSSSPFSSSSASWASA